MQYKEKKMGNNISGTMQHFTCMLWFWNCIYLVHFIKFW